MDVESADGQQHISKLWCAQSHSDRGADLCSSQRSGDLALQLIVLETEVDLRSSLERAAAVFICSNGKYALCDVVQGPLFYPGECLEKGANKSFDHRVHGAHRDFLEFFSAISVCSVV